MKIKELLPLVKVHGRTIYDEEKEALFCNWTMSGITLKVTGKSLSVKVLALSDQIPGMPGMPAPPRDYPCIGAVVDGELICRHECKEGEQEILLWQAESETTAELQIVKISENARGKLGLLEVDSDGHFEKYECDKPRMEIIGDSITCGFGSEASNNSPEFHTSEENGFMAYGPQAARALGYDVSMVCESGIPAVVPEHPMFPIHGMEDIYAYTDELYDQRRGVTPEKWDFEKNHNDVVVINLDTNDSNPIRFYRHFEEIETMEKWFAKKYKEFVLQVRALNGPETYIVCALGSMDYYLYHHIRDIVEEIKKETGDQKICSFEFIPINVMFEGYGAMGHPSQKTHDRMARELVFCINKYVKGVA